MISIIVPVYNEEDSVVNFIEDLNQAVKGFEKYEIILINDGSTDKTAELIKNINIHNLQIINHLENLGYGKSLYEGILAAKHDCLAIIDGDGSYLAAGIKELYQYYPKYDMVVGARQGKEYNKGVFKRPARILFKFLVEYATGRKISDVNSGLRIFKKSIITKFHDSLCTGFSFTTSMTLIFFLNHYYVKYVPVEYLKRQGKSKVKHFKDTLRAGQVILEVILYYNPVKLFLLIAFYNALFGFLTGIVNHFFLKIGFVTIFSAICMASFVPLFVVGLVADQLKKIYNLNLRNQK